MTALDDLSLLRSFVRIVESGSISAAARSFKLPQPTLSRHLRLLEEQCGVALLRRDTHSMKLTEAGQRLQEDAVAMLALAETATQRLQEDQGQPHGHLRVYATIDFGQFTVSRLLARFLQDHARVTASLRYTNRPSRMIEEGFDVGIVAGEITDDRVIARPTGGLERYLVATPSLVQRQQDAQEPADLESWPWVSLEGGQFGRSDEVVLRDDHGKKEEKETTLNIRPVLTSEGVTSMREAVRAGLGVAVLPDWLVHDDLTAGRLVRVLPRWTCPELAVHVIYPGDRALPLRVRTFIEFAVKYMTTEPHTMA